MLYHYTNGTKLEFIRSDSYIKAVPEKTKLKEKPVAWLSNNSVYEKTAAKIVMINGTAKLCNMEETAYYCNGLYRFCFEDSVFTDLLQWPRLAVEARIPQSVKKRLIKRAKLAKVSPSQWFGVVGHIPIEVATFEKWDGKKWVSADLDIEIEDVQNNGHNVRSESGLKRLPIDNSGWENV